jgi:hypothetical protein
MWTKSYDILTLNLRKTNHTTKFKIKNDGDRWSPWPLNRPGSKVMNIQS